ncbi:alpha/beta hydrolase [Actinomycetes bacterium KLBMP 9759]
MSTASPTAFRTATLQVPDATLHYELRGDGPLLALVGAPMDARSFAPIADLLAADYTVLTADPRGINRSTLNDPEQDSTAELRADDLSRLIAHVEAGPAIVFGSSGGAVTALALVQAHPEQVRTLIAHEPPLVELLEDRDAIRASHEDYIATYLAGDVVGAWKKFFAAANIDLPDEMVESMFGGERDPQTVADERFWFAHEMRHSDLWQPDLDALRAVPTRIIIGVGVDSTGEACDRTSAALAEELGIERTTFPGGHTGFADDAMGFAPRLLEVLRGA